MTDEPENTVRQRGINGVELFPIGEAPEPDRSHWTPLGVTPGPGSHWTQEELDRIAAESAALAAELAACEVPHDR